MDFKSAFDRLDAMIERGGLVQGKWHGTDADGREVACLLGALGEGINAPRDCPADLMPVWQAECLPAMFDGLPPGDVVNVSRRWSAAMRRTNGWSVEQWDRVGDLWMSDVVEQGLGYAANLHTPANRPAYWVEVDAACRTVVAGLRDGADWAARAAWAARVDSAAWAASDDRDAPSARLRQFNALIARIEEAAKMIMSGEFEFDMRGRA
jgi:hypothetical protein